MKLDIMEALRYLGAGSSPPEVLRRDMEQIADQLTAAVRPRYAYRVFSTVHEERGVLLREAGILLTGRSAARMLAQCDQAVLLISTLGAGFETMLRAEQARDMARAVMLDACGSAWVESGCNAAEEELAARFPGRYLTDRFSPGYGDRPLALPPAIGAALDAGRRVGVQVTDSFLMNPSKSVTAVIGLSDRPQQARIRGCAYCSMRETCTLRKGGKSCAL